MSPFWTRSSPVALNVACAILTTLAAAKRRVQGRLRRLLTHTARALYRAGTMSGAVVIIGGTAGICLRLAERMPREGRDVVLTGPRRATARRASAVRSAAPAWCAGIGLDLAEPETIAAALAERRPRRPARARRDRARPERGRATTTSAAAIRLVTLKLVGYTEVVHALATGLTPDASILLFGGLALRRPYPARRPSRP